MRRWAAVAILIAGVLVACQASGGITVTDARVGAPAGPNAALYFTASNEGGDADVLIGASTDVAETVELHETTQDDGTMGMRPVSDLVLPVGEILTLQPGGFHVMLIDVEPLDEGDRVTVTLHWESAGDMEVEAEVVSPAATVGESHDDG
jgi:copper(I)-binding protein